MVTTVRRSLLPETGPRFDPPAVWVSYGHAVYLGPSLGLAPHSTAVDCLALGVDTSFILRRPEFEDRTTRSVLVPARSLHQIVSLEGLMMFAYFDPSSARARGCRRRMEGAESGFGLNHHAEAELIRLCRNRSPDPVRLLDCAAGTQVGAIDPRIAAAIETMRVQPGRPEPAVEMARRVGLSRSYFLRLFTAQTGTSLRRYRLWGANAACDATGFRRVRLDRRLDRGGILITVAFQRCLQPDVRAQRDNALGHWDHHHLQR